MTAGVVEEAVAAGVTEEAVTAGLMLAGIAETMGIMAVTMVVDYFTRWAEAKQDREAITAAWRDLIPQITVALRRRKSELVKLLQETNESAIIYANVHVDIYYWKTWDPLTSRDRHFVNMMLTGVDVSTQKNYRLQSESERVFGLGRSDREHHVISIPIFEPEIELYKSFGQKYGHEPGLTYRFGQGAREPETRDAFRSSQKPGREEFYWDRYRGEWRVLHR